MRILFLTQVVPLPLDAGPKIRAFYVLRHLAEAGHQISLVTFTRGEDKPAAINHLRRFCQSVETVPMFRSGLRDLRDGLRSLVSRRPFLIVRDEVREMRTKLQRIINEQSFDAVHADQLWMAPYAASAGQSGLRTVLDQHNAVFQIPRRLAVGQRNPVKKAFLKLEAGKLTRFESETCSRFDRVVWVSDVDRQALIRSARQSRSHPGRDSIIPICVDPALSSPQRPRRRRNRVTFVGGMHWPPNAEGVRWFVREVWPRVVREVPDTVLTLIGKNPPSEKSLRVPGRIEAAGFVEDFRPYIDATAAFIVPLQSGGGLRVKILDAWCWRLPVVSTTVGAEGLHVKDGENIRTADTPEEFASALVEVLRNGSLADRLSENGRATVETHYDWKKIYPSWDLVYR